MGKVEQRRLRAGRVITRFAADIRRPGVLDLDEVVAYGADVHLERMSDNSFSLIVHGRKETVNYHISAARATVTAYEQWRDPAEAK